MTTSRHKSSIMKGRMPDLKAVATTSPLPPPEDIFIDWILSVPEQQCLETAARAQIAIIDRSAAALDPNVIKLRTLLVAVMGGYN